jgi:hypothetical protein
MADVPARDPEPRRSGAPERGTSRVGAFSVSLFLVATLLFLPPLVTLGEGPADLFGLPRIFVVLFAVWIGVVAAIYLIAERIDRSAPRDD